MKIAVIRIKGQVGIKRPVKETLDRLRLRKKYVCVVLDKPSKEVLGMVKKMKDFVAFGEISDETYKELVEARGVRKPKVPNSSAEDGERKKDGEEIKPFFRLHPPRKGIESKKHFGVGKGVLGDNKKMDELVGRML